MQGLPSIDYIVIGIYLFLMLGIGLYFSRFMKGGKDFFVGGNLIPWWVAGISLYMTLFSAWTFTGAASFTYNTGWYGLLYFAMGPISFFVGFQLAAKRWRRARVTTPVEYVQSRFNKTTHVFLTIVLAITSIYWPGHHLASLGKICAPTLFPNSMIAIDIMIVVTGIIILFYTFSGGFWAVCITDVIQFLILFAIVAVLIPVAFLSKDVGPVSDFIQKIPPLKFNHLIRGNTVYTAWYLIGLPLIMVFSNMVGGNAQRYYSVKDEKSAKKVGWLAFGLLLLGPVLFGVPPLIGKVLWPDIGMLEYFSNINRPDENIYIAVVMKYMPAGLVGIFLSAMMAASMSAMDSAWNAISSIISIDVYKTMFKPSASEKEVLVVGRFTVVALCLVTIGIALAIIHSPYGIFTITNIVLGLTVVPVSIPLLLGILYKKMSRWSVISSVLAGTLMASVARFGLKFNLGPQYIVTVIVTLLFVFLSYPLGRLYLKNKLHALFVNVSVALVLWFCFIRFNSNPDFGSIHIFFNEGLIRFLLTPFFWIFMSAIAFFMLSHFFTKMYAKDLSSSQEKVYEFFKKLETPIDVEKEVLSRGAKEVSVFPIVGGMAMIMAVLSLIILLFPSARTNIGVNLAFSGILCIFGLILFLSKRFQKFRTNKYSTTK
jgi:solute:Na+ symporter, SSS family